MTSRPHSRPDSQVRTRPRVNVGSGLVLAGFAGLYLVAALVRGVPAWVGAFYGVASLACFVAYAVDKAAAVDGRGRIREATLLALGLACGWPGAVAAQEGLRHKSAKRSFRVRFWITVALNVATFVAALLFVHPGR